MLSFTEQNLENQQAEITHRNLKKLTLLQSGQPKGKRGNPKTRTDGMLSHTRYPSVCLIIAI